MDKYNYYEYVVKVWYETDDKTENRHGVTCATSFIEAVKNIEKYYEKEALDEIKITALEDHPVYDFEANSYGTFFQDRCGG